jgi:hypothetical protein
MRIVPILDNEHFFPNSFHPVSHSTIQSHMVFILEVSLNNPLYYISLFAEALIIGNMYLEMVVRRWK